MSKHSFENRAWVEQLPIHLAERIAILNSNISRSGEQATAHELVAIIETVCGYLGRLWVAEYVHAGSLDATINRDLLDLSSRPVLTGHWVSLARRIRRLFCEQSIPTVVAGLKKVNFGEQDDPSHPVTRLIAYRNSFSHGSLASIIEDISTHRRLIEQLLADLPALWNQPIYCLTEEDGQAHLAVQGWPLATTLTEHLEPCLQPFILSTDGLTRLRLYPLLYAAQTEVGLTLRHGQNKGRQQTLETLFERETLRLWYGRYQREQQGHLDFNEMLRTRPHANLSPATFATVREALSTPLSARVIVEAHPGCGKADLIAHLEGVSPPANRVVTAAYVIEPGDLSQSGITFARFILRRTEAALGLDEKDLQSCNTELPASIVHAEQQLAAADLMLLVGIEDLHHGVTCYQQETLSIADVFMLPSGRAIKLLGTVHPERMGRHLPCDRRIVLHVPEPPEFSLEELRAALVQVCPEDDARGRLTLWALLQAKRPLTLFELCDALEAECQAALEPAVEQTLWRLWPLLRMDGSGDERRWHPLDGLEQSWL